jgi:hypothetical protein
MAITRSATRKAVGSRAQVWHGTAHHTSGGLKKSDLFQDDQDRIRSRKLSALAKKSHHLGAYLAKKGSKGFHKREKGAPHGMAGGDARRASRAASRRSARRSTRRASRRAASRSRRD